MNKIIVAGIDTGVGKTVASAVITTLLQGEYWKPIQCGTTTLDAEVISRFTQRKAHPPAYTLKAPRSPHHAARLENTLIDPSRITLPETSAPLIIEMAGGIFVPLNQNTLTIDVFSQWDAGWIVVSKHYLGSINHTLLTLSALQARDLPIIGIVFNGATCPDSEQAIFDQVQLPFLGRLLPEPILNANTIWRYAKQWKTFGTHLLKCKQHQRLLRSPQERERTSIAQMGKSI